MTDCEACQHQYGRDTKAQEQELSAKEHLSHSDLLKFFGSYCAVFLLLCPSGPFFLLGVCQAWVLPISGAQHVEPFCQLFHGLTARAVCSGCFSYQSPAVGPRQHIVVGVRPTKALLWALGSALQWVFVVSNTTTVGASAVCCSFVLRRSCTGA